MDAAPEISTRLRKIISTWMDNSSRFPSTIFGFKAKNKFSNEPIREKYKLVTL